MTSTSDKIQTELGRNAKLIAYTRTRADEDRFVVAFRDFGRTFAGIVELGAGAVALQGEIERPTNAEINARLNELHAEATR